MDSDYKFSREQVDRLFSECQKKRVAVIGDLMVDRYFWGEIERISPEAPVPVVEVREESQSFGGAANVANNLKSLGVNTIPFGVIGDDNIGRLFLQGLQEKSIDTACIFTDPGRPTTVKTRVIARNQHIVRVDRESRDRIPLEIENGIIDRFRALAEGFNAVIFQDYNKGVITSRIIREIIGIATQGGIYIAVDPKFHNFFEYKGVSLFKPNVKETEAALGTKIFSEEDLINCGREIFRRIAPQHLLITRGAKGITLFESAEAEPAYLPTIARKVHDVSGAGDTVIATLVTFYISGANLKEAAIIANYAAGSVCEEVGVAPVDREKLRNILIQ